MPGETQVGGWVSNIFVDPLRAYADWSARSTGRVLGTVAGATSNVGSAVSILGADIGQGISTGAKVLAMAAGAIVLLQVIVVLLLVYLVLKHGGKFLKEAAPAFKDIWY